MWRQRRNQSADEGELLELAQSPTWMYEWDLGGGVRTVTMGAELMSVHTTRAAICEPVVRRVLAERGPGARALDLACSEGWFAHRLLDWGAGSVVGIDIRLENIHRAELVRDHLGIDSQRLRFQTRDVLDLDTGELGTFDVVLCLGLIYHLENPVGALRVARGLTAGVCMVESQLTEQKEPIRHGWGGTGEFLEQPASWAAYYEPAELQTNHPIASFGGVVSFIPNRVALLEALAAAEFADVTEPPVAASLNAQYVGGHRLVVAGWP
jgi:hypothetical protein